MMEKKIEITVNLDDVIEFSLMLSYCIDCNKIGKEAKESEYEMWWESEVIGK